VKASAAELQATMASTRAAADGFKNVVGDAQFQSDLKGSMAELKNTLAAARGAAEGLSSVLGRFGGHRRSPVSINGEQPAGASNASSSLPTGFDFTYRNLSGFSGDPRVDRDVKGRNYGDVNFNAQLFKRPVRVGVANIGEGSDLTLQSGMNLGRSAAVSFGVYRSKLGAGAQIAKGRFGLEGNAWDLNDHSFNVYGSFAVTPELEVIAGRESIRGVRATAVGVRLRP
jgi:hypothetical protein